MGRSAVCCVGRGLLTAAALGVACAPRVAEEAPRPLRFAFSGCERVMRGPLCVLGGDRRLRLWVGAPPGAVVLADGRPPLSPPSPVLGGLRLDVEVPPGATAAVVEARLGSRRWVARLAVGEGRRPAWYEAASAAFAAGDHAAARREVAPWVASPSPAERGLALRVAARIDLAAGRQAQGEAALRQAVAAHRQSGALAAEILDGTSLAYRLIQRRELAGARALLAALPDPAGHADSAFVAAYHQGLLASRLGDLRSGLRQLRAALEHATRAGLARHQVQAAQVLARELQRVGRTGEAVALFTRIERVAGAALSACDRAQLRTNQGWALLLAREAGSPAADPRPLLSEAQRLLEAECAALPDGDAERANARVNLALADLQAGEVDAAARRLAEARRLLPRPQGDLLLWWDDLEARILLAGGRTRGALAAYRELGARARAAQSPEAVWRAHVGEAAARQALGDLAGAGASYAAAERLLERESLLVAVGEGRDTFVALRDGASRRHLDLLLRTGRDAEALAVARRARSRALRGLRLAVRVASLGPAERVAWERAIAAHAAAREALDRAAGEVWRLPAGEARRAMAEEGRRLGALRAALDDLLARFDAAAGARNEAPAAPVPGEVLLAYHPLPRGWVGFAATERGVLTRRLGRLEEVVGEPARLAEAALVPFAVAVRGADRVRVLPFGILRTVDFHALPLDGEPLVAGRPVVYGLDLPALPAGRARGGRRALVVGDPGGDLPGARAEAGRVAAALAAARPRWQVERLFGRRATGPAVRAALGGSALFHYAGHAVAAGWDSALPLAGGGRLTIDDVLALPRSPARVVLSGCDTGATPEESAVESMGLAHAFLTAGAESVVAAMRPLPDREAGDLVAAFYAELPRAGTPEEALRRAQLAARGRDRGGAWASFRAFVP